MNLTSFFKPHSNSRPTVNATYKSLLIDKLHSLTSLKKISGRYFFTVLSAVFFSLTAFSLPAEHYASSSALANGKWAKIEVSGSGMQFISNTVLRNLGFPDPSKVNVYGYGGRMLSEQINSASIDDLPLIPSVKVANGILFFGHSNISWSLNSSQTSVFRHNINPYSDNSYYFISDVETSRPELPAYPDFTVSSLEPVKTFTERIAHEQDLIAPGESGRLMLGEDFRTQPSRSFQFNLPDNVGNAKVRICFGAKVTNGSSSILVQANGNQLSASNSDKIAGVASSDTFISTSTSVKEVEDPGDKLNLNIKYSYSGALFTAALDYIEVEYPRELKLYNGELYFYLSPSENSTVAVEGCSGSTVLWDVTDPVNPKSVNFNLSGSTALFNVPSGYHEFVAFEPAAVSRTVKPAGKVINQNIHAMEAPDMLIITPEQFSSAATRLAKLHEETDGMKVAVLTPLQIYNEFSSGVADVTAYRKLLKMWRDRSLADGSDFTRYCLLFGRPTFDNKMVTPEVKRTGYPRIPIWQSPSGYSGSTSYSTDDYIGMLADNNSDLVMGTEQIHVAVGRFPVKSLSEANSAVAKLETYVKYPSLGVWRDNVMVIADDQDNGEHLTQAEKVINAMKGYGNGSSFIYEKLYLDSYPLSQSSAGNTYPLAKQRMMAKLSEGVSFINYIGHASPREWGHEKLLTWTDIKSLSYKNIPFLYAATCEFMRWDSNEVSGAEEMWLNQESGIIGAICPSRTVYISLNGTLNKNTAPYFFRKDSNGKALRVGEIMVSGKNATKTDDNKLRYGLIGDPALRIQSPEYIALVESIDGVNVENNGETPVLKARSKAKVTGKITDQDGNILPDFNGTVVLQLYDAEKVIDTFGNGEKGVVSTYNDRKTRLFIGQTKVTAGSWEIEMLLPSEIENNYSPAMIAVYAYDSDGREANGLSESLYVYGFDENTEDDFDGPEITDFYFNTPSFTDNSSISPSSTLYATLSDPSGINISDVGIGHKMTLELDGSTVYDDVYIYYTPAFDSNSSGTIAYPLSGIEPGEHDVKLTVWDNASNSSSASLSFSVRADWKPSFSRLETDVNPASASVNFLIATDGSNGMTGCRIDVYDISGKKVWGDDSSSLSKGSTSLSIGWDLTDFAGHRVPRGIYIYRVTLTTSEGAEISESRKLAVTAN